MAKSIKSLYSVSVYDIEDYKKVLDLALQQVDEIERNHEYSQEAVDTIRELIYELLTVDDEDLEYYFEYLMKHRGGNLYYLMQDFLDQRGLGTGMFLDYYSRAFEYLDYNNICDFAEAIDNWGTKSVDEIAYYYYYTDLILILDDIEIEYEFDE